MKQKVYRGLAYAVMVEVAIQAAAVAWAMSGLGHFVMAGGVFDKSLMEGSGPLPFPEVIGILIHGVNGTFLVPAIALALLVLSFFLKAQGAVKWALIVFILVVVQTQLGYLSREVAALAPLHAVNAMAIFVTALVAARRRLVPRGVAGSETSANTSVRA